jgi:hypothetical protein
MRAVETTEGSDARRVRPREVWRDLDPAMQARIRQAFVRVLLEALGSAAAPREVGRDAPRR